jgi:hypothetical protein
LWSSREEMMRILPTIAVLMAAVTAAAAKDVPLPRPRPATLPPAAAPTLPPEPSPCQLRLATSDRTVFSALPPLIGPGECGAPDVVRLEAVVMPDRTRVALVPPPTLRCTMAAAIADWVREEIGPMAADLGAPLRSIENYDSFDCRGMNRVAGAKLSEHGKANALDIRSLKLADGKVVRLTDITVARAFRERIRQSACARFKTVLGPGSDGYHEEHVHVDLAERHGDYRICQWEIHEPAETVDVPLPRPRPLAATSGRKL